MVRQLFIIIYKIKITKLLIWYLNVKARFFKDFFYIKTEFIELVQHKEHNNYKVFQILFI
jgi:hypothetical protein